MTINKNLLYYLTAIGIFILLKYGYTIANNNDLIFLLKPTNILVGLLTGTKSVYSTGNGYFHQELNILIDKSCSGFNFWLLSFLMLTFLLLKYFKNNLHKVIIIPFTLMVAYLVTIFVNASRIFVSIIIQNQSDNFISEKYQLILHESIGIITNLVFLIVVYYLTEKFLINKKNNAKLIKS